MTSETIKVTGAKVCAHCGDSCGAGAYRTREPLYFCDTRCAKEYKDLAFYEKLRTRGVYLPLANVRWSATEWLKWAADNLERVDVINGNQ